MASAAVVAPRGDAAAAPADHVMASEECHYVVTSHPPGGVLCTARCNFLSPDSTDVIIAKSRTLEVRQLSSNATQSAATSAPAETHQPSFDGTDFPIVLTVPIHGRLVCLIPLSHPNAPTSYLFFLTEDFRYGVLSYSLPSTRNPYPITTHAAGSLKDPAGLASLSREAECGPLATVDPSGRCIACHLFDGYITILPVNLSYDPFSSVFASSAKGKKSASMPLLIGDPYSARIEERTVLSIAFLYSPSNIYPQLALLHQDSRGHQHVVAHSVDVRKKTLVLYSKDDEGARGKKGAGVPGVGERMKKGKVDGGSNLIVPVPSPASSIAGMTTQQEEMGGILILGQSQITYHNTSHSVTRVTPVPSCFLLTCTRIQAEPNDTSNDAVRFILGDDSGRLHVLLLSATEGKITGMHFDTLGPTSTISSAIQYLGRGLLYIGSRFGDSQLVRILDEPVPILELDGLGAGGTTYVESLEDYTNLGPIVDFDLVPTANSPTSSTADGTLLQNAIHQQSQVITASGSTPSTGTLRLVRNGIGMSEYAAVEIPGIKDMWSLRRNYDDREDGYLVQSFVGQTRILGVSVEEEEEASMEEVEDEREEGSQDEESEEGGGTLEEVFIAGFDSTRSTLFAGNVKVGDTILQITEMEVRLIECSSQQCVDVWTPGIEEARSSEGSPIGSMITVASANESGQILVSLRGGLIVHLKVVSKEGGEVKMMMAGRKLIDREVSCIDLRPLQSASSARAPKESATSSAMEVDSAAEGMEVDGPASGGDDGNISEMAAVGLWDDFSVRLLNLSTLDSSPPLLDELLKISLVVDENSDNETSNAATGDGLGSGSGHGGRQNMMARSLCLVAMGSTLSPPTPVPGGLHSGFGGRGVNMLLVGLGDGTLVSYAILLNDDNSDKGRVSVHSRKEVSLGTQCINLVPLPYREAMSLSALSDAVPEAGTGGGGGGTCVLATGDRPTVVYLTGGGSGNTGGRGNPKLCYSNVNLSASADDEEEGRATATASIQKGLSMSVATPFASPGLFDSETSAGSRRFSLCVSDETTLRLGVIDHIQKLHVTTYKLGMAPRRVVHCAEGRLFAVGCIGGTEEGGSAGLSGGGFGDEVNMGNCVRFLDNATFEEVDRIDLEPHEMVLSMESAHLSISDLSAAKMASSSSSMSKTTGDNQEATSSMADGVPSKSSSRSTTMPYLLVGTAYAYPDEDEPTRGRILVFSCDSGSGGSDGTHHDKESRGTASSGGGSLLSRSVRRVAELLVHGGVYSICSFYEGKFLATVNSKTQMCALTDGGAGGGGVNALEVKTVGIGHHGHILSLFVKSRAKTTMAAGGQMTGEDTGHRTQTPTSSDVPNQLAIVGDLMRSISVVQYHPLHNTLEEVSRDYNANWTTAIEMLNENVYLGAENWNNLFTLRRNPHSNSEEVRCRLDTTGEYHLGEMCNKFLGGSLVMPHGGGSSGGRGRGAGSETATLPTSPSRGGPGGSKVSCSSSIRSRRPTVSIGSQTIYATVDGTIGSILGLDCRTATFFAALERSLARTLRPVGGLTHDDFRSFRADKRCHPSRGFVDGDLVESFLDLDGQTMEMVVREMNRDGGWEMEDSAGGGGEPMEGSADEDGGGGSGRGGSILTVEDVLAMVEEMTMLH